MLKSLMLRADAAPPFLARFARWSRPRLERSRWSCVSLSTLLGAGLGGLMLLAVGSVLAVGIGSASRNTTSLLRDKADLILASIEGRVRQHLDPVATQAEYLRGLIAAGTLDPSNRTALAQALRASLAATPQVTGIAFIDPAGRASVVERHDGHFLEEDWSRRAEIRALLDNLPKDSDLFWSPPLWSEPFRQTILPVTAPVYRDGKLLGLVVPAILTSELSRYVAAFSSPEQTAFVLYGRDAVIAHPKLDGVAFEGARDRPLPLVREIEDAVFSAIWTVDGGIGFKMRPGDLGHVVEGPDDAYIFIYREVAGYGDKPWIVGAAMPGANAGEEYQRLYRMAGMGLGLLLISVLSAVYVGRRLSRPIRELVAVTESVQKLDFSNVKPLPRSHVRELDAAGQGLNSMVAALRWFEMYLPRRLVHSLLARGEDRIGLAYEREVTVLFTDMRGFSRMAARLSPLETAAFLNAHFGLVGACIEAEGGTIDKYIGDSVMAFWGAPDEQPDHAERACRAALAIARALREDNEGRAGQGLEPVRLRMGLGTGKVLVGNIGAVERVNYTLVGDVVNVAQRLEQLGKEIDGDGDVIALITEDSHACLKENRGAVLVARREVRDRDGEIGIYRLV